MAKKISRRDAIRGAAAVTAAGSLPHRAWSQSEPYEQLNGTEAQTLEAVVARLIPSDARGPGAAEAGAARYIDRGLGGALAESLPRYREGLAALERLARDTHGGSFTALETEQQDALLGELETNRAEGFEPDSASFFELLLGHTIQGTFCDPAYGGNRDFVGWEIIGYPGLKLSVSPEQQTLTADTSLTRLSAYDLPMFDDTGGPNDD